MSNSKDIPNLNSDFTFPSNSSEPIDLFQENNLNDYSLQNIFEDVYNKPQQYCTLRSCRYWVVPENIHTIQPGQYCVIPTAGGGYTTEWYYYKTLNGRHMLIFASLNTSTLERRYSGREIPNVPSNDDF